MSDRLSSVLNEAVIERLASPRSFGRGVGYYQEGRVGPLRVGGGHVSATVQGARTIPSKLRADEGGPAVRLLLPGRRSSGAFCKHCVAVALSWLEDRGCRGRRSMTCAAIFGAPPAKIRS